MSSECNVQYVSDEAGNPVAVIVPIELWQEIESERETAYLLQSNTMKMRLMEAKQRNTGSSLEDTCAKLGI
jgi:PHD/YefM family antitoxin component YafN of YafNO toxin-antitoxin module